jgi:hypothetical protein
MPTATHERQAHRDTLPVPVVRECRTLRDRVLFERVPEILHHRHPAFVPPFPGSISKWLGQGSSFRKRHGEILPFLAFRDGETVGRIAAIVNRSHNSHARDRVGFFGFFDCVADPAVAAALFARAEEALVARSLDRIRGPYNPSIHDECGVLTLGAEHRPTMGLPWNPDYYESLLLGLGFSEVCVSHGFRLPLQRLDPPSRLTRMAERVAARSRVRLRPINLSRLDEDLEVVGDVYNATLERNWGFYPLPREDLLEAADELRAIAEPELITIAEQDGQRAGMALALPDINEFLASARRFPGWLRGLWVFALLRTRRPARARQVVYGIAPGFRDRGLHAWLCHEHFLDSKAKFPDATLGWIQENNTEVLELAEFLGGERRYRWSIYEKIPCAAH